MLFRIRRTPLSTVGSNTFFRKGGGEGGREGGTHPDLNSRHAVQIASYPTLHCRFKKGRGGGREGGREGGTHPDLNSGHAVQIAPHSTLHCRFERILEDLKKGVVEVRGNQSSNGAGRLLNHQRRDALCREGGREEGMK